MCGLKSVMSSEEEEHLLNSVMKEVFTGHKKISAGHWIWIGFRIGKKKEKKFQVEGEKAKQEAKGVNEC